MARVWNGCDSSNLWVDIMVCIQCFLITIVRNVSARLPYLFCCTPHVGGDRTTWIKIKTFGTGRTCTKRVFSCWRRRSSSSCWRMRVDNSSSWRSSCWRSASRRSSAARSAISHVRFCRSRSCSRCRSCSRSSSVSCSYLRKTRTTRVTRSFRLSRGGYWKTINLYYFL